MSLTEKATKPHFYCSKCGYHGEKSNHKRPGADAPCDYFAIEAEAMTHKSAAECVVGPCDCDPHIETCDQCAPYLYATKPQEPVGYQELFDAIAAATSVACFPGINISIEDFTAKIGPLYTTPQPCPKCIEISKEAVKLGNYILELNAKCTSLDHQVSEGHKNTLRLESVIRDFEAQTNELERDLAHWKNMSACEACASIPAVMEYVKQLEAERDALRIEADFNFKQYQDLGAVSNAESERLEAERDALAMQNKALREALKEMLRNPGGDYTDDIAEAALALPDLSAEVIKRHDAEVLRKAADTTLSEQNVLLDGMHGYTALKIQGLMIESLHLKADELEKS